MMNIINKYNMEHINEQAKSELSYTIHLSIVNCTCVWLQCVVSVQ